jgi:ribosomal protein S18 acetylase RimI-like enzyme
MINLRPERADDADFLFALFRSSREAEFAPLTQAQRESLLRFQHQVQARDYAERFPHSEHFIVELDGQPAGRLLLNRDAGELRVVDIAVLPAMRGRGIASTVLKSLISEAEAAGIPLRLSVWHDNPALTLYRRLGFCVRAENVTHLELEWRSPVV